MKNNFRVFIGFGAVIITLLYFLKPSKESIDTQQKGISKKNSEPYSIEELPEKYKNYKTLDSITNKDLSITTFKSFNEKFAFRVNDSIIGLKTNTELNNNKDSIVTSFYRIDQSGTVLDSISFLNTYVFQHNSYLVYAKEDYYLSFLINGDKTLKPIHLKNDNKTYSEAEAREIAENSDSATTSYVTDSTTNKNLLKVTFLKQDVWSYITVDDSFSVSENYGENNTMQFKELDQKTNLDYFHKEEWQKNTMSGGLYATGGRTQHWIGTSYFTVNAFENIKFKKGYTRWFTNNKTLLMPYEIYESPNKKFILIREMMDVYGCEYTLIKNTKE
ncbi:hypothetical protein M4I21_10525 [Cellulophaga sp. 20_2_10]|uniref:hypothetical protein n=1 Tax=Cellulophaga sp. 20_2_10 TaxID=2942476 RepID=UPI00201B1D72|nr:hypothetical protein [Cellulophaga sp. 20_2_10]MCL5246244.1 hypothetical protein [Cellulophaga sp. 20_2_10]